MPSWRHAIISLINTFFFIRLGTLLWLVARRKGKLYHPKNLLSLVEQVRIMWNMIMHQYDDINYFDYLRWVTVKKDIFKTGLQCLILLLVILYTYLI